jgi:hypothetical protein
MSPPALTATPQRSNAFARERDTRICWLLSMHPVTAAMLQRIGWFPSQHKALKRLRRLAAKQQIRLVGTVCRSRGRPEHVFCGWRPKLDDLLHEVELTELCFRLDAGRIVRGPNATDERLRPDAEIWINGQRYYLELDRGTMSLAQILGRFAIYEGCPHFVLWVCSSEERMERMRQHAERLRTTALFTIFREALASPHAAIWRDFRGETAALPRECEARPA